MQGRFIVLEGGEGVGKTTLARALKEQLDPERFVFTREPGGTDFAEHLRKVIFENNDDPFKELCLFFAARRDHLLKVIRPAVKAGKTVISDRYVASTYAYQIVGAKHRELESCLKTLVQYAEAANRDDIVLPIDYLWLDGRVEVCLARRRSTGEVNSFDQRPAEFHERVRRGFDEFFRGGRGDWIHFGVPTYRSIDAEAPFEEVLAQVLEAVTAPSLRS